MYLHKFKEKLIEDKEIDLLGQKGVEFLVTIGYQPNLLESDWRGIYAVEWSGDKQVWYGGLGDGLTFVDFDVPAPPPPPSDGDFTNLRFRNPDEPRPSDDRDDQSADG